MEQIDERLAMLEDVVYTEKDINGDEENDNEYENDWCLVAARKKNSMQQKGKCNRSRNEKKTVKLGGRHESSFSRERGM